MNNLGLIYYSMNNHEKASLFIEAAHQITLNNNGIVSHVSAISFNNLGSIKSSMGQYDEALTNFMHSRDIKMKLFGQKHLSEFFFSHCPSNAANSHQKSVLKHQISLPR